MLNCWLSEVSVKNGRRSSELPTHKSCQFSLLTSQSGLSLCWAKSTHRKGRTSHHTQAYPTCPLLFKTSLTQHQGATDKQQQSHYAAPTTHTVRTPSKVAVVKRKVGISHSTIHVWIPGSLFNLLFYLLGMGLP